MNYEDRLKLQLADLAREYQERARPIIDQLVKLEAMKPPKPIVLQVDPVSGQPIFPLNTMQGDKASNIFDRIGERVHESWGNTKAEAVAICINEAGVDALLKDERIYRQQPLANREALLKATLFGLPFKLLDDRPGDKFPSHWRFYLEYRSYDKPARD